MCRKSTMNVDRFHRKPWFSTFFCMITLAKLAWWMSKLPCEQIRHDQKRADTSTARPCSANRRRCCFQRFVTGHWRLSLSGSGGSGNLRLDTEIVSLSMRVLFLKFIFDMLQFVQLILLPSRSWELCVSTCAHETWTWHWACNMFLLDSY